MKNIDVGDWVVHTKMQIVGKVLKIEAKMGNYVIFVADHLKEQIWGWHEVELYQKKDLDGPRAF